MFWDGDEDMEKQQEKKSDVEYRDATKEEVEKSVERHDELFKKLAKS
jgi:hypothetical protein